MDTESHGNDFHNAFNCEEDGCDLADELEVLIQFRFILEISPVVEDQTDRVDQDGQDDDVFKEGGVRQVN